MNQSPIQCRAKIHYRGRRGRPSLREPLTLDSRSLTEKQREFLGELREWGEIKILCRPPYDIGRKVQIARTLAIAGLVSARKVRDFLIVTLKGLES